MTSTYTPLGFNLQGTGDNVNTHGVVLNDEVFSLADEAIRGIYSFSLSGSATLTATSGVSNQARRAILNITGGTGGTVTIPSVSKLYVVRNNSTGDVIITMGGATTATVPAGEIVQVFCDAAAVYRVVATDFASAQLTSVAGPTSDQDAATKKYVDDTAFSMASGALPGQPGNDNGYLSTTGLVAEWRPFKATAAQIWAGSSETVALTPDGVVDANVAVALTDAATVTPSLASGRRFTWTIGGNRTLAAPTNAHPGDVVEIDITQDGTGSRLITYAAGVYKRAGGPAALTTTAAGRDKLIGIVDAVDGSNVATRVTYDLIKNPTS